MMKRNLIFLAAVMAALVSASHGAIAQELASQIVGVWKRTGHVQKDPATGAATKPLGEHPSGPAIFTKGGHFMWTLIPEGRKPPASPVLTDADRIALYDTLSFGSGTYKVDGNAVLLRYDSSWNQMWTGTERRAEMRVAGNTLTWTSPLIKGPDGKDFIVVITMERAE